MHVRSITFALATAALACSLHGQSPSRAPAGAERLFQESPSVWFEEYFSTLQVTPGGRRALYSSPFAGRRKLVDLGTGRDLGAVPSAGITEVRAVTLGPAGTLAFFGTMAHKAGWFVQRGGKLVHLPLPADALPPIWSPDGRQVAFARRGVVDTVFAGRPGGQRAFVVSGKSIGLAWLPDGSGFLVLTLDREGTATLSRVDLSAALAVPLIRDLDPPTYFSPLSIVPGGRRAYVALAGPNAPDRESRHRPHAARQLGIYELDLNTGSRRPVVPPAPGTDAYAPWVEGGYLYWIQATTESSIVLLPIEGGEAHVVARDAMVPSWRPDGRQVGFVWGEWRWADWALNWDGAVVQMDSSGRASSAPEPLIVGYHEDFQPVWSPHGRWIAYHSHRTATPVAAYAGNDHQPDDIWLRRVGAPARDSAEIRLTDFGDEAGSPDWSSDGTRLLFTSYAPNGPPGVSYPYIVTIDTLTGRAIGHERMPLPKTIHNALWAAWSPVRDEVAIETAIGGGRHALWVLTDKGTGARRIVEYPLSTFGGVSWTPDARMLVYTALAQGRMQLFAVPAAGGSPRQLTRDAGNLFTPRVSPDGRFIAATRITHRKEIWRMPLTR